MSKIFSATLFFISFTPLWLSILFINVKSIMTSKINLYTEYISVLIILIFYVCSMCMLFVNLTNLHKKSKLFTLITAKKSKVVTSEFMLAYILPLVTFEFTQWDGVVLFSIFYFTLSYLYAKYHYFSSNIILELLGYSTFNCDAINDDEIEINTNIVSKNDLTALCGNNIRISAINNEYHIFFK
ncbi:MAG: hypothetical protein R3Y12_01800 [Clostridia bacterium]